jgi:hypothetical protein
MASLRHMGCCALSEIVGLQYDGSAKDSLRRLCRARASTSPYTLQRKLQPFGNVLIFTGVVSNRSKTERLAGGYTYGPRFSKFIEKEKLGTVKLVAKAYNSLNHPGHLVATWVWNPDNKAIQAWWERDQRGA